MTRAFPLGIRSGLRIICSGIYKAKMRSLGVAAQVTQPYKPQRLDVQRLDLQPRSWRELQ